MQMPQSSCESDALSQASTQHASLPGTPAYEVAGLHERLFSFSQALARAREPEVRRSVCHALAETCSREDVRKVAHALPPSTLQHVMPLLRLSDLHCVIYASVVLANLAFDEHGQELLLGARAPGVLLQAARKRCRDGISSQGFTTTESLEHEFDPEAITLTQVLAALQNLTFNNADACAALAKRKGHTLLRTLLSHPAEGVRSFAAGALANMHLCLERDASGERLAGSVLGSLTAAEPTQGGPIIADLSAVNAIVERRLAQHAAARRLQAHARGRAARQLAEALRAQPRALEGGTRRRAAAPRGGLERVRYDLLGPALPPVGGAPTSTRRSSGGVATGARAAAGSYYTSAADRVKRAFDRGRRLPSIESGAEREEGADELTVVVVPSAAAAVPSPPLPASPEVLRPVTPPIRGSGPPRRPVHTPVHAEEHPARSLAREGSFGGSARHSLRRESSGGGGGQDNGSFGPPASQARGAAAAAAARAGAKLGGGGGGPLATAAPRPVPAAAEPGAGGPTGWVRSTRGRPGSAMRPGRIKLVPPRVFRAGGGAHGELAAEPDGADGADGALYRVRAPAPAPPSSRRAGLVAPVGRAPVGGGGGDPGQLGGADAGPLLSPVGSSLGAPPRKRLNMGEDDANELIAGLSPALGHDDSAEPERFALPAPAGLRRAPMPVL